LFFNHSESFKEENKETEEATKSLQQTFETKKEYVPPIVLDIFGKLENLID
jgi:hypothetical protein